MENVHPSDFLRIMGGPAGRAIASDVERACNVLLMMEIEDSEYALGEGWTPSLPIPAILSRIVRPSIYIVQQAVNPSFSVLEGHFHLPENTLRRLRSALRKILEVIVRAARPLHQSALMTTVVLAFDIASEPRLSVSCRDMERQ